MREYEKAYNRGQKNGLRGEVEYKNPYNQAVEPVYFMQWEKGFIKGYKIFGKLQATEFRSLAENQMQGFLDGLPKRKPL